VEEKKKEGNGGRGGDQRMKRRARGGERKNPMDESLNKAEKSTKVVFLSTRRQRDTVQHVHDKLPLSITLITSSFRSFFFRS
jgi:hypothetical protein